jgi:hypothetical protein
MVDTLLIVIPANAAADGRERSTEITLKSGMDKQTFFGYNLSRENGEKMKTVRERGEKKEGLHQLKPLIVSISPP